MHWYVMRRLLQAIPILLGITIVVFGVIHLAPGDPFTGFVDPRLSDQDLARARAAVRLDQPVPVRYLAWLQEVAQGNLGWSLRFKRPVTEFVAQRLGPTLALALSAQAIALALGIPLGVISATRQGSLLDHVITFGAFAGLSLPVFFFALLLLRYLSFVLKWLPSSGMLTPGLHLTGLPYLLDRARHLALPALVLGVVSVAGMMRYVRSGMLEVVRQDYVRTARGKGLSERVVLYRHALRNALIPVVTIMGLSLPGLVGGAVITESLFIWPGMGRLGYTALLERDYPVQMACLLMTAVLTLFGNLAADLAYVWADPRIRYDG